MDEPEEHSLVAEFGMYYKSPEIAPLAQPANPLEATTGAGALGGGTRRRGTRRHGDADGGPRRCGGPRGGRRGGHRSRPRRGRRGAAPAGAGAATGAGAAPAFRQAIANFAAAL